MSDDLQHVQRSPCRLATSRNRGSIVLEATFLLPIILVIAFGIYSVQSYYQDQLKLQKVLDYSLAFTASRLLMLMTLESENEECTKWALESASNLNDSWGDSKNLDLIMEPYFRSSIIEAQFSEVFLKTAKEFQVEASCTFEIQEDALVAYGTLKARFGILGEIHIKPLTQKVRILCDGVKEFVEKTKSYAYKVYLTPHGVSESSKFHTHKCWSLIRAKQVIVLSVDHVPEGFPNQWHWQGKWYTLCGFCERERFGDKQLNKFWYLRNL